MPRWNGPRLTEAEKKAKKREYDMARHAERKPAKEPSGAVGVTRRADVRKEQLRENDTRNAPLERPAVEVEGIVAPAHGLRIANLPDAQVRPGVPIEHLRWYGEYIARKQPDVINCIGDFSDMPSLSTYIKDSDFEAWGLCYRDDIDAAKFAMDAFMTPIARAVRSMGWNPLLIFEEGNHEDRIDRAVSAHPRLLKGVISKEDLCYEEFGWTVYPFLQPVVMGGVAFCHYFPSGVMGKPITSAAALLRKMHMSCVAGHQQGRDIAYSKRGDGQPMTGIITGSFYTHNESYLSPFTNQHWRGGLFMHEVKDGHFDEMWISVDFLRRKFGK